MPPAPRLQVFPGKDLAEFKETQHHRAEEFGWVDKKEEIAHVPIEQGGGNGFEAGVRIGRSKPIQPAPEKPVAKPGAPAAAPAAAPVKKFSYMKYLVSVLGSIALAALTLSGQSSKDTPGGQMGLLKQVGFEQKLDAQLPLETTFRDETGRTVTLAEYFNDKPVVLVPVYYECPMLCNLTMGDLVKVLKIISSSPARISAW